MKVTVISGIAALLTAQGALAQENPRYGYNHYPNPTPKPPKVHKGVRATFTNSGSGLTGQVSIYDGTQVFVGLEITDPDRVAAATHSGAGAPDIDNCLGGTGFKWQINETWGVGLGAVTEASNEDIAGERLCNAESTTGVIQTGNQYDPTIACPPDSQWGTALTVGGLDFCSTVLPSSAVKFWNDDPISRRLQATAESPADPVADDHSFIYNYHPTKKCSTLGEGTCAIPAYTDEYVCDPCWYPKLPYGCSVGDFSGKYGPLAFEQPELTYTHRLKDRFLAKPKVFKDRSVILMCADGTIAACAKLVNFVGTVP